jgi:hypothetical protein
VNGGDYFYQTVKIVYPTTNIPFAKLNLPNQNRDLYPASGTVGFKIPKLPIFRWLEKDITINYFVTTLNFYSTATFTTIIPESGYYLYEETNNFCPLYIHVQDDSESNYVNWAGPTLYGVEFEKTKWTTNDVLFTRTYYPVDNTGFVLLRTHAPSIIAKMSEPSFYIHSL